jgi:hypothetical protein
MYPDAFIIEEYLWNDSPQSPITCVAEIDDGGCKGTVFALGDRAGRVTVWGSRVSSDVDAQGSRRVERGYRVAARINPADGEGSGGVSSIIYLENSTASTAELLVGYVDAAFMRLATVRIGGFSASVESETIQKIPVPQRVVTVVGLGKSTALAFLRDGTTLLIRIDSKQSPLARALVSPMRAPWLSHLAHWEEQCNAINLFREWEPCTLDPRHRGAHKEESDDDDDTRDVDAKRHRDSDG